MEKLLILFPPEEVEARRWEKIAKALGNRTSTQVLFLLIDFCHEHNYYFINLAFCTGRSYTGFYPYSESFSKICTFLYLYILSHVFSFWNNFPPPSPFAHVPFFSLSNNPNPFSANLIRNLKPSLIYEVSLAVLFSAVMQCL